MSQFDESVCRNLDVAIQREWLEANGIGGFASSTITGMNTRRYHGLLVAATKPPVGRMVLLSKLEETLIVEGRRFDLRATDIPASSILRATCTSSSSVRTRSLFSYTRWTVWNWRSRCSWFTGRTRL